MATEQPVEPLLDPGYEDNQRLYYFVGDVQERFDEIISARYVIFPEEMREPVVAAFNELTEEQGLERGGQFPRLRRTLDNPPPMLNAELENAGLTGNQLLLKLRGYLRARNEFRSRAGMERLKRLLKWMNSLLGSMALVPVLSNLVEPIKELKEAIENMIEDTEGL
jgi:hypothetical protein